MAQVQLNTVTVSVPVADALTVTTINKNAAAAALVGDLVPHDENLNNTLTRYRAQGWDLVNVIYVPPGPIPAHFQLFFIKQ